MKKLLSAFTLASALAAIPVAAPAQDTPAAGTCRLTDPSTLTFYLPADGIIALDPGEEWPRVAFYTAMSCYDQYKSLSTGKNAKLKNLVFDMNGPDVANKNLPAFREPEISVQPAPDSRAFIMVDRFEPKQAQKARAAEGFILKIK